MCGSYLEPLLSHISTTVSDHGFGVVWSQSLAPLALLSLFQGHLRWCWISRLLCPLLEGRDKRRKAKIWIRVPLMSQVGLVASPHQQQQISGPWTWAVSFTFIGFLWWHSMPSWSFQSLLSVKWSYICCSFWHYYKGAVCGAHFYSVEMQMAFDYYSYFL